MNRLLQTFAATCISTALVVIHYSANAQDVFTDPEKAGADFEIQGEYSGAVSADGGETKLGVQVIALGKGKFRAVGYAGGLPGDGWNGEETEQVESTVENEEIVFRGQHAIGTIADGKMQITTLDGSDLGVLDKVERKSKTLGESPPRGAVVLFDGQSADGFKSTKGGPAKMTDDGLLTQGANSKHLHGDCTLHIEFRLPFQPNERGQRRGNSGVYLQGRYEIQMLDSFGLSGEHNECGGLYSIKKPDVNMCYPPLSWQTYDVDFTAAEFDDDGKKIANARMTVRHNGVMIHNDVELPKTTTAAPVKDSQELGYLHLQDHGNPVRYRNIWILEK